MIMAIFTSSLPDKKLEPLPAIAKVMNLSKNQIIYDGLTKYLFEKEFQYYIDSFERVAKDTEMQTLDEIGLSNLDQLKKFDAPS
jgi:hypothetical protein